MPDAIHLDTMLMLIPATSGKARKNDKPIEANDFADRDRCLRIFNPHLALDLRNMARQEMALTKVPVGDPQTPVEFYLIDLLKERKKLLPCLERISAVTWLRAVQEVQMTREVTAESFLSATLTDAIERVIEAANFRKFLANALDTGTIRKTRLRVLLFHHVLDNAPEPAA